MKVIVLTLVRNNANWLPHFYMAIDKLKVVHSEIHFDVHVYENDSTDLTKRCLRGMYTSQDFGDPFDNDTRTSRLAKYRNDIKNHIDDIDSYDYVLMIDSNIIFSSASFTLLLKTLEGNKDIAMATTHSMVGTSMPCEFYYDTFAMGLGQFDSVFECRSKRNHDRHCHCVTGKTPMFSVNSPENVEVDKCFGGFALIRADVYNKSSWGVDKPEDCEHWKFCADVRKHGKIVINRRARVMWYE